MDYPNPEPNYRPLTAVDHHFNTIVGHDVVKRMLWRMVVGRRLPNALLFRGPEGVGKRSLAYATAKIVNGEPEDASDANPSRAARNIATGDYLDLRVVKPEGAARQIKIGDVREVTDWAYVTPVEARKKIVLICEADRMNVASANCFLKALEEPPSHCLIILTTSHPHTLLETIRSRCSAVWLHPVPSGELSDWLQVCYRMDEEQASIAALLGEGRPGHALAQLVKIEGGQADSEMDLWDQVAFDDEEENYGIEPATREKIAALVDRFYEHGFAAIFGVASDLMSVADNNLGAALTLLLMWYRDLAVRAVAGEETKLAVNRDLTDRSQYSHTPRDAAVLGRSMRAVLESMPDASRPAFNFNGQLALEALLMRLGEIQRGAS